jgi:hypothetical protein
MTVVDKISEKELNSLEVWVSKSLDRGYPIVKETMQRAIVELRILRERQRKEFQDATAIFPYEG